MLHFVLLIAGKFPGSIEVMLALVTSHAKQQLLILIANAILCNVKVLQAFLYTKHWRRPIYTLDQNYGF